MTDTSVAISVRQQPPAPAPTEAPALKPTAKVRRAIDAMVWQGLKRADAATTAGLKEHSLYVALRQPHVKAYYLRELEVLRTSERARNLHRLAEIRDAGNNMPAVQAIGMLERMATEQQAQHAAHSQVAGFVIMIESGPREPSHTAHVRSTEAKPLIEHESGASSESGRESGTTE